MKMILAIMPDNISDNVSKVLLDSGYRVTKFASTAGILTGGTTTLMIGIEDDKVDSGLAIIREHIPPLPETAADDPARVTIYVLNIKDFERV
jgi:uncharacterized protein YaaQ